MATYIPAIRAKMGDLDYFVSVTTLGEAARMVEYVEEVDDWTPETPPELKLQRKLNVQRVEREMVPYLVLNPDHFYSALTVEIRPAPRDGAGEKVEFLARETFPGGLEFGVITLDGTERLCALDGQHRLKSIKLAMREKPELAREHIALILVPFKSTSRSQTLFSDLNRYARAPSKSISLLFTHREGLARLTKILAHSVPLLKDRVNMESTSLSSNSRHFITLSTLYEMTKVLVGDGVTDTDYPPELLTDLTDVWSILSEAIPQWRAVGKGEEHPAYLRQRYLNMHGVGQQAIATLVAALRNDGKRSWKSSVRGLASIDWRLTNPRWESIALQGGRVNNTATSVRLLAEELEKNLLHRSIGKHKKRHPVRA